MAVSYNVLHLFFNYIPIIETIQLYVMSSCALRPPWILFDAIPDIELSILTELDVIDPTPGSAARNLPCVSTVDKPARSEFCSRRFNTRRETKVVESTLVKTVIEVFSKRGANRSIKIFPRFMMESTKKYMVPSRTITSNKCIPLPIVNALYKVSEKMARSKMSTPVHNKAPYRPCIAGVT